METPLFSILFFSLFFTSLIYPSLTERCNPNDKKILFQIKESLNNPYTLASWTPNSDCCEWYCVECDPTTNRINSLTIFASADISGQIPSAVGDLPFLKTLRLHKLPNLIGEIPPSIAKLKNLDDLALTNTNLSGPIPSFLSQLKKLRFLALSFNNLSGSIPSSLSTLPIIFSIGLDRNRLTGSIPASFGRFIGTVPYIDLSHNQLSGKIPISLGDMDFPSIDLSRNRLEGDASMLFGKNKTTESYTLSRNLLEFDLTEVEFPMSMTYLDLSHNKITGSLPVGLTSLELQSLNVSYNRMCGQIPIGGKLQSFDYTSYFHNRCLCGAPLPACK